MCVGVDLNWTQNDISFSHVLENLLNFWGGLFLGRQWLLDLVFPRASAAENSTGAILSVVMATTPSLLVVSRTDARKCLFWIYYWNQSNLYNIKHNLRRIYMYNVIQRNYFLFSIFHSYYRPLRRTWRNTLSSSRSWTDLDNPMFLL